MTKIEELKEGTEPSQRCNRNNCTGIIQSDYKFEGGCSCHIDPPCAKCTSSYFFCPDCGWEDLDDYIEPTYYGIPVEYKARTLADLDSTKVDYIVESHTHFSIIKKGVYPKEMTIEQVHEKIKGTFGGRFEHFGGGKFKYIAYTD